VVYEVPLLTELKTVPIEGAVRIVIAITIIKIKRITSTTSMAIAARLQPLFGGGSGCKNHGTGGGWLFGGCIVVVPLCCI